MLRPAALSGLIPEPPAAAAAASGGVMGKKVLVDLETIKINLISIKNK